MAETCSENDIYVSRTLLVILAHMVPALGKRYEVGLIVSELSCLVLVGCGSFHSGRHLPVSATSPGHVFPPNAAAVLYLMIRCHISLSIGVLLNKSPR